MRSRQSSFTTSVPQENAPGSSDKSTWVVTLCGTHARTHTPLGLVYYEKHESSLKEVDARHTWNWFGELSMSCRGWEMGENVETPFSEVGPPPTSGWWQSIEQGRGSPHVNKLPPQIQALDAMRLESLSFISFLTKWGPFYTLHYPKEEHDAT
jgi:hypothetical protein